MSGSPFSATEVTAGTVSDDTTLTLQPYPCSMMNEATLVTTWAEAQFISVIETSPHSFDCACAATGAAIAPAASIVDSLFIAIPFQFVRRARLPGAARKVIARWFFRAKRGLVPGAPLASIASQHSAA